MSKHDIIIRSDFKLALSNHDRNRKSFNRDKKYVNNILDYFSDDSKKIMSMLDYFTGKINKHEEINLVLEDGHYASKKEYDKRKKYINNQFNNSNVWRLVISPDKELVENNITWRELEIKLAKEILPKFFKKIGFENPKKMCYQFSLHTNTEHPHFHVSFMEKEPNIIGKNGLLQYRRSGEIPEQTLKYLMNEITLTIEREKHFRPLAKQISSDIDELKKYFNPKDKNFVLYDKKNILFEDKILQLGKMLYEAANDNNRIKFNSIRNKEINDLTREIKKDLFNLKNEISISKDNYKKSIDAMNKYIIEISKRNNIKKIDLSYTIGKEKYVDNYILNAIVNYSKNHYVNEKNKVLNENNILKSIILNVYKKNLKYSKKDIIKNSFNKNYQLSNEIISAIKNINREMDAAAEEFYRTNGKDRFQ